MNRIIQNEPDHPVPAPKTLTSPVLLNTLPFTTPVDEVEISLSARRLPGTYPIAADALPPECNGTTALPSPPYYFMRFGEMSDEGLTLRVKLARHPEVACAWLTHQIIQALAPHAGCWFTSGGSVEFWYACPETAGNIQSYRRIILKVEPEDAGRYRLLTGYGGTIHVLKKSILRLNGRGGDTRLYGRIVFRKKVYGWDHLPPFACYHYEEAFPVLNARLADALGIGMPSAGKERYTESREQLHRFLLTECSRDTFRRVVQHTGRFTVVAPEDTGRLHRAGKPLMFGEGRYHMNPATGMQKYGPLSRPTGNHFRYFLIYSEEDSQLADELLARLQQRILSHPNALTCMSIEYSPQQNIVLKAGRLEEQVAEVVLALRDTAFYQEVMWYSFYISSWRHDSHPGVSAALYHRITELLLWRQVAVQTVCRDTIQHHFDEAFANIAGALTGKLGGIPWLPSGFCRKELVVGFNTERQGKNHVHYAGAVSCFMEDGKFSRFEVLTAPLHERMAGWAVDSYLKARRQLAGISRLVVHTGFIPHADFLKHLTLMANEVDPELPVVVLSIRQPDHGLLPFCAEGCAMPPDGTWVRCSSTFWLLAVNGRHKVNRAGADQELPLAVSMWCNRDGYLEVDGVAESLLDTVYAFTRIQWQSCRHHPLPVSITYPARMARHMPWFERKMLPPMGCEVACFL